MSEYPKYEKVNDSTIRIISIKPDEISVEKLLETKKMLEEKKEQIEKTLININEILENAKQLGLNIEKPKENK